MGRTVFITGVSGFIGRHVAGHFSEKGWVVTGLDVSQPDPAVRQVLSEYFSLALPSRSLAV